METDQQQHQQLRGRRDSRRASGYLNSGAETETETLVATAAAAAASAAGGGGGTARRTRRRQRFVLD